ncbi:hypothetical protein UFOVP143_27 [uncultured Caudovirales phage]|uniref:Uncharacterized protein n=1 Tax=uncultured Caudovirales phage TaxID=2100421 RepID=A0A6J7VJL0_9CAUD|nr:hypothetical protein UFOVP143_27 [uncultured Caudovirales phage]
MTAYARIITIGRNDTLPKVVSLPIGVGVDGRTISWPLTVQHDEIICPGCLGWGSIETWDGNPGHRSESERCTQCDGNGIVEAE